ncbi:LOW QUALITY PROTEIN: hypothetical protein PHMEG_00038657 [Phytophthora megakarya]|uniref:SWIM-type domain-containing protein n=1 Tax=Phytophthora megakarya TaxID=4795 RepID=A0A225UH03_9STRA|nr:LOW QUALITY PROTEIN: hypothetical protein PHMEG_00038657 [Phytophthora megakarya]
MTSSLLAHQRAVIDQVLYSIQRHGLRSRPPATISDFLRRISALMSKYVLKRTVGMFVVSKSTTTCQNKEACTWEVFTKSSVFTCDDIAWTCTCAFYTSQYLPCQHLLFVAHNGHGFEEFPPSALSVRWNMDSVRALASQLEEGIDSIVPVLDIVKLVKSRSNANGRGNVIPGRLPPSAVRTSQVAFIRLDRSERGENVVLTHAEKYNIARSLFDPVIDRLSRLSSAKQATSRVGGEGSH